MALWDKKGLNFLDPVYTTAEVNVIRNVQSDLKNEQKSIINQFPNDYEIWKLGYFEPDTGKFIESKEKVIDVEKLIEEKNMGARLYNGRGGNKRKCGVRCQIHNKKIKRRKNNKKRKRKRIHSNVKKTSNSKLDIQTIS